MTRQTNRKKARLAAPKAQGTAVKKEDLADLRHYTNFLIWQYNTISGAVRKQLNVPARSVMFELLTTTSQLAVAAAYQKA